MNLFETLSQLKPITAASGSVPTYLTVSYTHLRAHET